MDTNYLNINKPTKTIRKRAFLRSIHILVPQSWSYSAYPAVTETEQNAEILIDRANPAYGDSPYTLQTGDCGQPGDHLHLTPWYVNNFQAEAQTLYGRADKVGQVVLDFTCKTRTSSSIVKVLLSNESGVVMLASTKTKSTLSICKRPFYTQNFPETFV